MTTDQLLMTLSVVEIRPEFTINYHVSVDTNSEISRTLIRFPMAQFPTANEMIDSNVNGNDKKP